MWQREKVQEMLWTLVPCAIQACRDIRVRKGCELGHPMLQGLFRRRQIVDGPVHKLRVLPATGVSAVDVDPLRERCRGLNVDACHLLVADAARTCRLDLGPYGFVPVE